VGRMGGTAAHRNGLEVPGTQKASELRDFTGPTTTRKPWCQSCSMSSYPVPRSLPPTRRSSSDENLVPGEAQDKPLNPHDNLSLLRATRMASDGLRCPR